MTDSGNSDGRRARGGGRDAVLRAKYLDYCSARVAEVLLRLSADDMYLLAQEVSSDQDDRSSEPPSFNTIVRRATERISRELDLPDFPQWAEAYRKDPEPFEQQMLGFWEAEMSSSKQDAH